MSINLTCMPNNAASRRYMRRFLPMMAAYMIALFSVVWIFNHHHPAGPVAYLLAALPALPLVGTIVVVGLYLAEEKDEFQRAVLVQSMLWGIGATLALMTVWGFLELFLSITHLQAWLAFPIFWFFVGIATPIIRLWYR